RRPGSPGREGPGHARQPAPRVAGHPVGQGLRKEDTMYAFAYDKPTTLADVLQKIGAGGQPLAGGQTLIASLKQRLAQPETLVDLAGVAELAGIRREANALVIGAMTRHEAGGQRRGAALHPRAGRAGVGHGWEAGTRPG